MNCDEKIRSKVKCCACEGSLTTSKRINVILLMKEAQWKHPCWGNIVLRLSGFASAIICDKCVKEKKNPKLAVEWNNDLSIVKYHPVKDLKDVPKDIFSLLDELEPGRQLIGG